MTERATRTDRVTRKRAKRFVPKGRNISIFSIFLSLSLSLSLPLSLSLSLFLNYKLHRILFSRTSRYSEIEARRRKWRENIFPQPLRGRELKADVIK